MQQLHLVGFTADHEGLIFSARKGAKSGGFVVTVDERLLERIEEAVALRNGTTRERSRKSGQSRLTFEIPKPPRPQSSLTPREMQSRIRAGHSVSEVADEAGVDEDWVARFAAPVLAEQLQVVERAGRMVFTKQRLGDSSMPLRDAVARNLVDKGIVLPEDKFDQAWSAYQQRDGTWIVRFTYVSRKHGQRAEWTAAFREKVLLANNRLASELAYVEKGRSRRGVPFLPPPEHEPAPAAEQAVATEDSEAAGEPARGRTRRGRGRSRSRGGRRPASRRAVGGRAAAKRPAKKTAAKKTAAKKTAAKKTTAKKTAAKKTAAKKTATRPASARKSPARKTATRRAPARKVSVKKATAKKATAKKTTAKKTTAKKTTAKKTTAGVRRAGRSAPRASKVPAARGLTATRSERPLRVRPLVAPGRAAPTGGGVLAMTMAGPAGAGPAPEAASGAMPEGIAGVLPASERSDLSEPSRRPGGATVAGSPLVIRAPVASSSFSRSM